MLTRTLGKSGLEVSALGLGCWAVGGPWTWKQPGSDPYPAGWGKTDDEESIRAIHAGIDLGINFFDTAANYGAGHSEKVLGKALKEKRDGIVIATKFGHIIDEKEKFVYGDDDQILTNVRQDCENSLRRLDTDYIDIYQLHAGDYDADKAGELMIILEDLVKEGKIRWYGWSTDLVDRAKVFAEGEHCTSIQFRLNALFDDEDMRTLIDDADMVGINKDPLNKGFLTGKFSQESTFPEDDIRSTANLKDPRLLHKFKQIDAIKDIFTTNGHSMAQAALAYIWALDERMVPIPGFKSVKQVEDNVGALERGPLSTDQMDAIKQALEDLGPVPAG